LGKQNFRNFAVVKTQKKINPGRQSSITAKTATEKSGAAALPSEPAKTGRFTEPPFDE
jgi:hypothetical protein